MSGTATAIDKPGVRDTSGVPDRFARHFTLPPTPRVERLRAHYQSLQPVLRIELDRIMARVMRETEGEPMISRRAKAFAAVVREVPIEIFPDEPFVGWVATEPAAVSRSSK